MNKPAPKEPSMDEILSSIRQIIADDDAAAVPAKPAAPTPAAAAMPSKPPVTAPPLAAAPPPKVAPQEPEPLALTSEQILREEASERAEAAVDDILSKFGGADFGKEDSFGIAAAMAKAGGLGRPDEIGDEASVASPADEDPLPLVDPEDITFELEDDPPAPEPEPMPAPEPLSPLAALRERPAPPPAPEPTPSFRAASAAAAGAEHCPRGARCPIRCSRVTWPSSCSSRRPIGGEARLLPPERLSMVSPGVTLEDMMRDMLRPMLKEWLDEHLPSVVERMVEKEIARISRGE
jgi:uncharacterized protein